MRARCVALGLFLASCTDASATERFLNDYSVTVPGAIASTDTTITLKTGQGQPIVNALVSNPGDSIHLKLEGVSSTTGGVQTEYVTVTAATANVLTVSRAQDGTAAWGFFPGAKLTYVISAAILSSLSGGGGGGAFDAGSLTVGQGLRIQSDGGALLNGSITLDITDGAISNPMLADGSVGSVAGDGSITGACVLPGACDLEIAASGVQSGHIASGAVQASQLGLDAGSSGAVSGDGSITGRCLLPGSGTCDLEIAATGVQQGHIASGAVRGPQLGLDAGSLAFIDAGSGLSGSCQVPGNCLLSVAANGVATSMMGVSSISLDAGDMQGVSSMESVSDAGIAITGNNTSNFTTAAGQLTVGTTGSGVSFVLEGARSVSEGNSDIYMTARTARTSGNVVAIMSNNLGTTLDAFAFHGGLAITQQAMAGGSGQALSVTGGAHTLLTAATENIDVNLALNRTVQFVGTGDITTQRAALVQAPTYAFASNAHVITNAATLAVSGAPVAGTNATLTNRYSLWVQGGVTELDGSIQVGSQSSRPSVPTGTNLKLSNLAMGGFQALYYQDALKAMAIGICSFGAPRFSLPIPLAGGTAVSAGSQLLNGRADGPDRWCVTGGGGCAMTQPTGSTYQTMAPHWSLSSAATTGNTYGDIFWGSSGTVGLGAVSVGAGFVFTTIVSESTNTATEDVWIGFGHAYTGGAQTAAQREGIWFGFDPDTSAQTGNWQFVTTATGLTPAFTKTDLGNNFPRSTTNVYQLTLIVPPNASTVYAQICDITAGAATGPGNCNTVSQATNLPSAATPLVYETYCQNNPSGTDGGPGLDGAAAAGTACTHLVYGDDGCMWPLGVQ